MFSQYTFAFMRAFGCRPAVGTNDGGRRTVITGKPGTESRIRTERPVLVQEVKDLILRDGLSPEETEALLSVLVRDCLPSSYLCKIRKVGA